MDWPNTVNDTMTAALVAAFIGSLVAGGATYVFTKRIEKLSSRLSLTREVRLEQLRILFEVQKQVDNVMREYDQLVTEARRLAFLEQQRERLQTPLSQERSHTEEFSLDEVSAELGSMTQGMNGASLSLRGMRNIVQHALDRLRPPISELKTWSERVADPELREMTKTIAATSSSVQGQLLHQLLKGTTTIPTAIDDFRKQRDVFNQAVREAYLTPALDELDK